MRRRRCGRLHGGRSQLLFALHQSSIDSQISVENRIAFLPTPPAFHALVVGALRRNIRFNRVYERDGQTDGRTDRRTPHDGMARYA